MLGSCDVTKVRPQIFKNLKLSFSKLHNLYNVDENIMISTNDLGELVLYISFNCFKLDLLSR